MAPKKKSKKQERELEEEAIAEWLARGHAIKDFAMEKMLAIWLEEDGGDEEEEEGSGSLDAKQELIKGLNVLEPIFEQAKEFAEKVKETVKEEAANAIKAAWKYAEISPLKRRRLLREHVTHVNEMDREANKYVLIRQRVRDEWQTSQEAEKELVFGLKKRNARKAPLLLRPHVMKVEANWEQQARLMEDIERKRRERMDAELSEKQRQRAAREAFADAQRLYRRKMNMKFWKKQYVNAKEYAEQHSQALADERHERFDDQVQMIRAEVAQINAEEEDDYAKFINRHPTTSSIGVFSTAFEPGEWESATDGEPRDVVGERMVGLFSSRGFEPENELLRTKLMEAQSKVMALREKLDVLDEVKANLLSDKKTIFERKGRILTEIKQVNLEHEELSQQLAGPPRREPTERDKLQVHTLVTRRAAYFKQLQELNARDSNIQKRSELAARSEQVLRPILVKELEIEASLQSKVNEISQNQVDLPMIVGRSIQPDAGMLTGQEDTASGHVTVPLANPLELYTELTMASKLKILENAAIPVREHFEKAKNLSIEEWKTKELKLLGEHELEVTKTRLSKIRDRMIAHQKDTLRADLMRAITRFHNGPLKLRRCIFPLQGRFEWWQSQDPKQSNGLIYNETLDLIQLDPASHDGKLSGCVRLPKSCVFRIDMGIRMVATNAATDVKGGFITVKADEGDQVDNDSEKMVFYVGSDFDSLQEHAFVDIGGAPIRAGRVSFDFCGSRLCFSVELTRQIGKRPKETHYRLVVENAAAYEERIEDFREEESRIRLIQKENHVLSELVKTLRMHTKRTSSGRCADLLEELVVVESSTAKTWDSALLHGYQQRFDRVSYAGMLRGEIKKELAKQIDQDVLHRKGRLTTQNEAIATESTFTSADSKTSDEELQRRDVSRLEFFARKHALVEPQYRKSKISLGEYCSFKAPEVGEVQLRKTNSGDKAHHCVVTTENCEFGSIRHESFVMGLRLEWREGKTKLHVMHKLYGVQASNDLATRVTRAVKPQWCPVESMNAVLVASACAKALKFARGDEEKERDLLKQKKEQVTQLQDETKLTIQQEVEAEHRETVEDATLLRQKESELNRRAKLFRADAIRATTYNEQVSVQVEFLAQRKLKALEEHSMVDEEVKSKWTEVLREVKQEYANKFVEGRIALVKKTWDRKAKRIQVQREKERRERAFRIQQERQLVDTISASNTEELALLQLKQAQRTKDQLNIPKFEHAVKGVFACEHRELKAWGSKYDSGIRCKNCGKEMSKSFDDPDHTRGADPALDHDIQQHRAQATGGNALRLKDATHFERIEHERLRLEKEAREAELLEAMLYDRTDPKAIEDFNYRHNMNRHPEAVESDDPLHQRMVQESHHAAFQDDVLFHGRLKNYHFRIHQLTELHARTTTLIAVQSEFLETVQEENEFVLSKLPLVEQDHARAVMLVDEDQTALRNLEVARKELSSTRKERERAYYALEGVEEEAEFAEFHAPSLIESSDAMSKIVHRMREEVTAIESQVRESSSKLAISESEYKQTDRVLSRLYCRNRGSRVRTKYGFCRVSFYRDFDNCVVVSPDRWEATIIIPVEEVVEIEAADRQSEAAMMESEETRSRSFLHEERVREANEAVLMTVEEREVRDVVLWRKKKVVEEELVQTATCDEELACQFAYETDRRKELFKAAAEEAKALKHYSRVSLKRRTLAGKSQVGSSRLDIMRVTRANEKRISMAFVEQALLQQDAHLRHSFQMERDALYVSKLSEGAYDHVLGAIIKELCVECLEEEAYDASQSLLEQNHGLVLNRGVIGHQSIPFSVNKAVQLDRLWLARRHKAAVMHVTWEREYLKLQAFRFEIARRDEIFRQEEEERLRFESRRKEMLAAERYCRKFYLEEMLLCMQERKVMASAELEMREYMRQLELEAMKAKYASVVEERNKANDKATRRLEIKLGKNEKHRLYREWAQVKIEDDLSMQVRDEETARAQAEALERQFDRFLIQQAVEGKLAAEGEAARAAERIREAHRIAAEKRATIEAKLVQEHMIATVEAYHLLTKLELQWMNAVERAAFWKNKSDQLLANIVPMEVELERMLAEKDHVVADAKAKRAHANACKKRANEADASLRLAITKEEECSAQYRKVHFLNATMDSEVLHDRPQRFRTRYLRDQLHTRYFYLLTESIIRSAIVECNEREAARLHQKLREIEVERAYKMKEIGALKRNRRRHFHMHLKRSELGNRMFGFSRRRLLKERFQQWVKLWSQRVMVRASFEVKHGLLMQQHRLQQRPTQLMKEEINTKLTILHQHQKRLVQCRLCKLEYTEEQNNRYACSYHSGAYELACVSSCPSRVSSLAGVASTTAANCMIHRARRWLCCDATDEGRYGSNGCAKRFHLPQRANPALRQLVEKKENEEVSQLGQLQKQLNELKERDTLGKFKQATKSSVVKAEQDLAAKRAVAAKYFTLDRR